MGLILSDDGVGQKFYLFDGHGDVVLLANASGNVIKTYSFDAFGNERTPDPADTNPFRYCAEYFDNETGTIYLRARYYNPTTGRFFVEDPIRDGLNWYVYGGNNPLFYLDPFGLGIIPIRNFVTKYGGSYYSNDYLRASVFMIGNITLPVLWTGENIAGINITNNNGYLSADSTALYDYFANALVPTIEEEGLKQDWIFNVGLVVVCLPAGYVATTGATAAVAAADTYALQKMSEAASRATPAAQAAGGQVMSASQAARIITNAQRTGRALEHTDAYHRAASYLTESQLARGTTSFITGGDSIQRTKLTVEGVVNGVKGIFEFIIEPNGTVSHQLFKPF